MTPLLPKECKGRRKNWDMIFSPKKDLRRVGWLFCIRLRAKSRPNQFTSLMPLRCLSFYNLILVPSFYNATHVLLLPSIPLYCYCEFLDGSFQNVSWQNIYLLELFRLEKLLELVFRIDLKFFKCCSLNFKWKSKCKYSPLFRELELWKFQRLKSAFWRR